MEKAYLEDPEMWHAMGVEAVFHPYIDGKVRRDMDATPPSFKAWQEEMKKVAEEEASRKMDALADEFLQLRVSPAWDAELLPAIRGWVDEHPGLTADRYNTILSELRGDGEAKAAKPALAAAAPAE